MGRVRLPWWARQGHREARPRPRGRARRDRMVSGSRNPRQLFLLAAVVIALVATALTPTSATAQTLYGSIVGTVSDQQGASLPGVTVTATNTGTAFKAEAVSDERGNYTFRNLLPGTYDVATSL